MNKTVLIIEDDHAQMEYLKQLVYEVNAAVNIYTAMESAGAYKILMEKTIDVFLVDIILNPKSSSDTSGIKLVEKMRSIPKYMFTPVLFVTSLEDASGYAYRDLNCLGYIEKPFDSVNVKRMIGKALNYSTEKEKDLTICFRKDGILFPIKENDIVYIESKNHVIYIHLANGDETRFPYMTCKQILEGNDTSHMMQCSRSIIVNKEYVYNIDFVNRYIELKNNLGQVEIGITYKKKVNSEYEK